jgi:hypothetical protein
MRSDLIREVWVFDILEYILYVSPNIPYSIVFALCDLPESLPNVKAGSEQLKNTTKGMLLSGLVYPGLGQLILGHVFSGIIFVLLATTGFSILLYRIIQRTARVIDQILPLLAGKKMDVPSLIELLNRDFPGGWQLENISLIGIVSCWLVAIGHACFVGKKMDRQSRLNL